ncbi:methylation-associated defense system ATP-binding protein MAD8 [Proteiniphilum saccharofermentans]|uniref:methylation-associated defense system ATP-binding protein MAD8 n=1 Tax=Proteiniphilum saccharofermentans TaxID=1642647 RepID=UPI0028ABA70C|nr:ATP-binding protein [Proteiniphilum saccharofermentans]
MDVNILTRYYQYIIELIVDIYKKEFENAKPGHCMKITGLGNEQLLSLWEVITNHFKNLDTYIVDETQQGDCFISATKLIELRNQQKKPLLILVPSNSRTAAEDSYGNATFKEISLDSIEPILVKRLKEKLPIEVSAFVNTVTNYVNTTQSGLLSYLLAIEEDSFTKESIGRNLFYLGLFPDLELVNDENQIRSRLNLNGTSCNILASFNKSVYDRVDELQIKKGSLQKDFIQLFRNENNIISLNSLVEIVGKNYPELWFDKWDIPNLNFKEIKLEIVEIRSTDFTVEEGKKVLLSDGASNPKVTIRFKTLPEPKDIEELKYFRIVLMAVDGYSGQEIATLRKLKNTNSRQPYREAKIELNANNIEEGSYFFKVLAEDELGNILNVNDDFYEDTIQRAWEEKDCSPESKKELNYKLKCDSEDFDYFIDINTEKEETIRKDKLNNVLQAFFKYNIDRLRQGTTLDSPQPSELSNVWLNDDKIKLSSVFHINYSNRHNYQIILSSKLRLIENEILNNSNHFGFVNVTISNNNTSLGLQNSEYTVSSLTDIAPKRLLESRKVVFEKIKHSNDSENGVLETANLYNLKEEIKTYLEHYNNWLVSLNKKIEKTEVSEREKENIKLLYTEVQFLDTVKVKTKLPTGGSVSAVLLSPLHPIRLTWFMNLIDQFEEWFTKSLLYNDHLREWQQLESLFLGELNPSNSPFVLVDPNQFINYEYLGELSFGWGIYINSFTPNPNDSLVPISHQLKYYFRHLLNIDPGNIVNNDVSRALVVKHLKNFLIQHPYTDTLIINLFNVGDADVFADAFVDLSKLPEYYNTKFEVRIFVGQESLIEHGLALKALLNPETNISEEAELFSQPSQNRLFPKLRFSINNIEDFVENPIVYNAHISFLVNSFAAKITLYKPYRDYKSTYLNSLIIDPATDVEIVQDPERITWNNYVKIENPKENLINKLYTSYQVFTSGSLAAQATDSIPATQLSLTNRDQVLLSHLHEYSDWVITFDKNLGPQFFDQPSENGKTPFLLDYIPGEEVSGISSYLTTKPSSEIIGLLSPHFESFGVNINSPEGLCKIQTILEDLRAISSSLVLQLNSSKNKAFEAIGTAFSKRILEKKGLLEDAFLIPIDLHQNLFENLETNSKSRADNLFVSINKEKREIKIAVLEIKCRSYLGVSEREELKAKMVEQINNTIVALKQHFDPNDYKSNDRLDREIKNKELKSLFSFYIERAYRYNYLSENAYNSYIDFIQTLNNGFGLKFTRIGFIFDFSFEQKHQKQNLDDNTTIFTFGNKLIGDILDPDSDLNTKRLEDTELNKELVSAFESNSKLKPFIHKFKSKLKVSSDEKEEDDNDIQDSPDNDTEGFYDENSSEQSKNEYITESNKEVNNDVVVSEKNDPTYHIPEFDIIVGKNSISDQFGIIGTSIHNKKIAIDLSETNTISLFGVQGGGKSYTIGTISEMVLKQFSNINKLPSPLAGVIFHYSESMDYEPEFTSMINANTNLTELEKLKELYGAEPDAIEDVIILTPSDKVDERREDFPSIQVEPIAFNSKELNVQDWMFLLGAVGNDSSYIKQLKFMMKEQRRNITLEGLRESVEASELLSNTQKSLARQKLSFAQEYINDSFFLKDVLKPGRLIIVDLRDEFIVKDEALGLFVIMLNIFSGVKTFNNKHFNKFIVFDEAHKYMDNKDLTNNIVTAIREMRHKGVSIMIASQDPPSLPNEIIELSSIVLLHKFNSPQWLKHIQKSLTQLNSLTAADMSVLKPGEGFLWASKASEQNITTKPVKISTRPRVTNHGGATKKATGN